MTQTYETLEIEHSNRVATIWMNRPAVFNAFDEQLITDLNAACTALDADPTVRVVVLAGRGRHFSAGADLNWMKRASTGGPAENLEDARRFAKMLRALADLSKPTIARVQGAALGVSVGGQDSTAVSTDGVTLQSVTADGAAAKAGLKEGDQVTRINDFATADADGLIAATRYYAPGTEVKVTYNRDGQSHTVEVTLGSA